MARTNKYASINFNEIYGPKKPTSSPSNPPSPSQRNPLPANGTNGRRMLILTRPSKPQLPPPTPRPPTPPEKPADPIHLEPDSISLRPLGRTDLTSQPTPIKEVRDSTPLTFPKPEPFVPPHLRPGFVGRKERLEQDGQREKQGFRARDRSHPFTQGQSREYSPPRQSGEDERPRSGGYEGMKRGGLDLDRNRPSSGGNRPSSSGGNGSYRSPPFEHV